MSEVATTDETTGLEGISTDHDEMMQDVVPQLYEPDNPRVLKPNTTVRYKNGVVETIDTLGQNRVITVCPDGVTPWSATAIATFASGYMMPPTSLMGDMLMIPLMEELTRNNAVAVFWAPYGRGTENPETNQGRWSVEDIRRDFFRRLHSIMHSFNKRGKKQKVIGGHSLAGQMVLDAAMRPREHGFTEADAKRVLSYCPVPTPESRGIWLIEQRKFNWELINTIIQGTPTVLDALLTGRGAKFTPEATHKILMSGDNLVGRKEILERAFEDSGVDFLQTLLSNSSRPGDETPLSDTRLGIMAATQDTVGTSYGMEQTLDHFRREGADLRFREVEGHHFAPFLKVEGMSDQKILKTMNAHRYLLRHAFAD